jgi:hypothetical protein
MQTLLGIRRQEQASKALASFKPYKHKVTPQIAQAIREEKAQGQSTAEISRQFHIDYEYVRGILRGLTNPQDRHLIEPLFPACTFTQLSDQQKLYWFAGFLEGEGCFSYTQKNMARIHIETIDPDIVLRIAEWWKVPVSYSPQGKLIGTPRTGQL